MTYQTASLEYRRASTQHASVVGLVIALHDTLIGDLKRAADAMERNDIATRCEQLVHGFKVLTQLEAMLDRKNGGQAAINIDRFYKHVRAQMLTAQFKLDPAILHLQVRIVLEVREAWQQVDSIGSGAARSQPGSSAGNSYAPASAAIQQSVDSDLRSSFSCSG